MKHKLLGILVGSLTLLALTGCAVTPNTPAPPTEPGVTDAQKDNVPNSDATMIEYIVDWSASRKGLKNTLLKSIYTIKYDGTIDGKSEYSNGNIMNIGPRVMSEKQTQAFYHMLTSYPIGEEKEPSENDATYTINLFESDGTVNTSFTGVLTDEYRIEFERYLFDTIYGEEDILLEVAFCEVAPTPERDDVWESSNWKVCRDGTVEYYDMYKGGPGKTQTWDLTEKEIQDLQALLKDGVPAEYMIPCDIPLYDIKYYNEDCSIKVDFWGSPDGKFLNRLMKILDKREKDSDWGEPLILAQITAENWGLMALDEDSWLSTTWELFSDGTVNRTVQYRHSGEQTETWVLSDERVEKAYEFFSENKKTKPTQACDGTGYNITIFETGGTVMYDFSGYIYGTPLEEFEQYLAQ